MEQISNLLKKLNIKTNNLDLYIEAFTHPSSTNETGKNNYERLEFLGDVICSFVISNYLFKKYPNANEKDLTLTRQFLVRGLTQTEISKKLKLDTLIIYSIGEKNNIANHDKIIGQVFESFIGAIYLDQGLEFVEKFLLDLYRPYLINPIEDARDFNIDPKSTLQIKVAPDIVKYVITKERNIKKNDDGYFIVEARSGDILLGVGKGANHKEAEIEAARDALKKIVS